MVFPSALLRVIGGFAATAANFAADSIIDHSLRSASCCKLFSHDSFLSRASCRLACFILASYYRFLLLALLLLSLLPALASVAIHSLLLLVSAKQLGCTCAQNCVEF
jgi:hypothetical protein